MRRIKSFILAALMALSVLTPALAGDRVQWPMDIQPPSSWLNTMGKDGEFAIGQLFWDAIGRSNNGMVFTNMTIAPNTGLYVDVQPSVTNTMGSLYAEYAADLSPFGTSTQALPADPLLLFHQGLLKAATPAIGPLNAPGTAGQSTAYTIECQTQTVDQTLQTVNFVNSTNVASTGTANRDRADKVVCQSTVGVTGTSPTAPAADSGWLAVGSVTVPYATVTITTGMITQAVPFNGFLPAGTAATFMDLSTNQTAAGNKTFSGQTSLQNFLQFTNSTVTLPAALPAIAGDYQASPGMLFNVASGSQGYRFYVNNVLKGQIDNGGFYSAGSSNYGPTSMNVNGTATINGGTFDGTTLKAKSTSNLLLNSNNSTSGLVGVNYNNSATGGLLVYDGGTANAAVVTYANGLTFTGASTNAYGSSNATLYGNLSMPNQAAGQCAQFDASHHLVAAGGACGLTSGTISSVTGTSPITASTSSGAVTVGIVNSPTWLGASTSHSLFDATPNAATGYNVYVSSATGTETKQNSTPIAIGTGWTEPTSGLISGSALPTTDAAGLPSGPAAPTLGQSATGALAATTYYVKVTYVNASGESVFASSESSLAVSANNVLTVTSPAANSPANSIANLIFGNDQQEALTRSGSAFKLTPWIGGSGNPTLQVDGGFLSGSSTYGPTFATVNGSLTAAGITDSGALYLTATVGAGTSSDYISRTGADNIVFNTQDTSGSFAFRNGATTSATITTAGLLAGSSTYGPTSATVNGTLTLPAQGTATSSTTYGSNLLTLNGSAWSGTAAYNIPWSFYAAGSGNFNFALNYNAANPAGGNMAQLGFSNDNFNLLGVGAPIIATLGQSAGGAIAATTYYVKLTYVNVNGESLPGPEASLAVTANNVLVVTSPVLVADATGYNVYVSTATGTETKQNASAIAIGTNWTEPTTGLISGAAVPTANTTTGAFNTGSSTYGPTSATVNGLLTSSGAKVNVVGTGTTSQTLDLFDTTASAATPNKYFRVSGGHLQVVNNAFNTVIFDLTDAGALTLPGAITEGSSTYGPTSMNVNGASQATTYATNGGVNLMNDTSSSGQNLATVFIARDGAATQGLNLNVPTASTNGWRFLVNGASVAQINPSGTFLVGSSSFGSTSATVNGTLTATTVNDSGATASTCAGFDASHNFAGGTNCLVNVTAGSNITVGTGTSPSVALVASPSVTSLTASGTVTGGGLDLTGSATYSSTGAGVNANTAILYPNAVGTGYVTYLGSLSTASLQGVSCTALRFGQWNNTTASDDFCADGSGNGAVRASMYASSFFNGSRREWKHGISSIDGWDAISMLPDFYRYQYNPDHGDPTLWHLGYMADGPDGANQWLAGPKHDHFDAGALATLDGVAIKQLNKRLKVVESRQALGGGIIINGTTHDPRVDALQQQVRLLWVALGALALLLVLAIAGLIAFAKWCFDHV